MDNELIKMVAQKTGIPEDKAETAAETVVNELKKRLPQPIASQLDSVISGTGGGLGNAAKDLGGMFGGKQ